MKRNREFQGRVGLLNRRSFLSSAVIGAGAVSQLWSAASPALHIATNVYPWMTFYRRQQREWSDDVAKGVSDVAQSGVQGFEPIAESAKELQELGPHLKQHSLEMRSIYVNSKLHQQEGAEESIDQVLEIAEIAKSLGTKIVVTNPSPIRWGGTEDKSDPQLRVQAKALNRLGAELRKGGLILAYHTHDAEMRQGAREFHHMLTATDPNNVKLCLDSHWIYRGCGNSQIALFDAVEHYHDRIVELHLRQSKAQVWTERFSMEGDIDYNRLFTQLRTWKLDPHLVLEQAVEAESPDRMTAIQAHRAGRRNLEAALE